MNRGEVWWSEIGGKRRPVVILTRPEVVDVRELVTVAELTTTIRGLAVEVRVDKHETGVSQASVVNCDGLYTVRRSTLSNRVGKLSDLTMRHICQSVTFALGC
ncbi:type II toxin-antitoxin system PemK/MazF family toxin [Candidatus Poriferisocius sp.]|uniref:type II toxin-antitoxin system PemK/MazF family toxin n=1 Tax=Candidatus Poriferisocius sp. TaxID=3101276 RepID=UPI003B02B9B3